MGFLERIADFGAELSNTHIPDSMHDVMRLCLLDWAIVARAACDEAVTGAIRAHVGPQSEGQASVIFGGYADQRGAALCNGTIGHALDYDDTHFAHIGHVSTVVLPAALAAGEASGADLARVLRAAALGAETAVRTGLWLGRSHYQVGFHQTATAGAFGAALAASVASGDASALEALRIIAGMAGGLRQQFGTMMKPANAGFAAAHGVEAMLLARAGMRGSADALEGPQGFGATHHGEAQEAALNGLGTDWIFEDVTYKFYPCCHGTHAAIEALRDLRAAGALTEAQRLEIRTHPRWMSVCNKPNAQDPLEVKFSYRMLAALLWSDPDVEITDATLQAAFPVSDAVRDLVSRIDVIEDASVTETAAEVRATDSQGRSRAAQHDLTGRLSFDTRLAKISAKGAAMLGEAAVSHLWAAIVANDLQGVTKLLRQ